MSPDIGRRIKKARIEKSISQKELAHRINKSNGYLSDIENGNKLPSINVLYSIAYQLRLCPGTLIGCKKISCSSCMKQTNNITY